jgi:hypothetical protein
VRGEGPDQNDIPVLIFPSSGETLGLSLYVTYYYVLLIAMKEDILMTTGDQHILRIPDSRNAGAAHADRPRSPESQEETWNPRAASRPRSLGPLSSSS